MGDRRDKTRRRPLSVLLVEGETEEIFYTRIKAGYLDGHCRAVIEPIRGLFNVNKKILGKLTSKFQEDLVRAYCCLDRESRYAMTPGFDLAFIRRELANKGQPNILSVDAVIAVQMVESWFFHDLQGIYKFLRVRHASRHPKTYNPPERFRVEDLKALFRLHGTTYCEGRRAQSLIDSLDLGRIVMNCRGLREGIELIRTKGNDSTFDLAGQANKARRHP